MQEKRVKDQTGQSDEEDKAEFDIQNFDRPDFEFKPNEVHEWTQQGPYLICKGCELIHATYVGMGKLLVGLNDKGQPIFKRR